MEWDGCTPARPGGDESAIQTEQAKRSTNGTVIMINPISLLLIGPFFEMGNSEMKVHTVGKDHTKQKIVACEVPVIPYQMKYESEHSKQKKQRGPSLVGTLFRHCVVSVNKSVALLL